MHVLGGQEDGWWHKGNEDTFIDLAQSLLDPGMSEEEAYNFLEDAYRTVADEYGD